MSDALCVGSLPCGGIAENDGRMCECDRNVANEYGLRFVDVAIAVAAKQANCKKEGYPLNFITCLRSLAASHRMAISLSEGSLIAREIDDTWVFN